MTGYWLRVLGAFALLKAASSLMRDAEKLLGTSVDTKDTPPDITGTAQPVVDLSPVDDEPEIEDQQAQEVEHDG